MRFVDIKLESFDYLGDYDYQFNIPSTDELVETLNNIRKRNGNTDLITVESITDDPENEVTYDFFLNFNTEKQEIKIWAICYNTEKDDDFWYCIPLFPNEETMLLFKVIEQLVKEM